MDIKQLFKKYKDVILYLLFGGFTTVVNVASYWLCAHPLGMGVTASTVIAWFLAVLFAYLTNRKWVFHSEAEGAKEIALEIVSFFACRIATGVLDLACMYVFVELLGFNDVIIKFLSNVMVVILNFVASKLLIFRRRTKAGGAEASSELGDTENSSGADRNK